MENIWIFILFGTAFGAGIGIGKEIVTILNEWLNISIDYIFNKFIYDGKEDEEKWN